MEKCTKIQVYHVELFAAYLEKLRATPDGDGSLLDQHRSFSTAAGSATAIATRTARCRRSSWAAAPAAIKGGRHLVYPEDTPLTNLQLTLLDKMGVPVEKLGDSTGKFSELPQPRLITIVRRICD